MIWRLSKTTDYEVCNGCDGSVELCDQMCASKKLVLCQLVEVWQYSAVADGKCVYRRAGDRTCLPAK